MKLDPALMGMAHPKHIVLVGLHAGEGKGLKGVHDLALLL